MKYMKHKLCEALILALFAIDTLLSRVACKERFDIDMLIYTVEKSW